MTMTVTASPWTAQRVPYAPPPRHPPGEPQGDFGAFPGVTGRRERADWSCATRSAAEMKELDDVATTTLTRPQQGRVIAGVCAGLAQRFGWKANVVRLLFLLSCLLPGPQFVIYLVLWLLIPKAPY